VRRSPADSPLAAKDEAFIAALRLQAAPLKGKMDGSQARRRWYVGTDDLTRQLSKEGGAAMTSVVTTNIWQPKGQTESANQQIEVRP
jgi:hypothetical protein